jgi:hypothetical protein
VLSCAYVVVMQWGISCCRMKLLLVRDTDEIGGREVLGEGR